jgi:hypothetical protein
VVVWTFAYSIVDAAPAGTNLMCFAFVNYTTLGYGDIIPTENWKLLGPLTAMNGVLLFGWSTAAMFEVLRRVMVSETKGNSSIRHKAKPVDSPTECIFVVHKGARSIA